MRLFAAIPISEEVRAEAAAMLESLRSTRADFKWVEPENLHWTLHFLGETEPARLEEVRGVLREASAAHPAFRLALGKAGSFPSGGAPRTVWVGLSEGEKEMDSLAQGLREGFARRGYRVDERPFAAHLTLGRMRSPRGNGAVAERLAAMAGRAAMRAEEIVLFESRLSQAGPTYVSLGKFPLGGS